MEKAYLLNDYVNELEQNQKHMLQAEDYLQAYLFRVNGSKTIDELKQEVYKFLEQNNVDVELKDELIAVCEKLDGNSDLYKSSILLENIVKEYVDEKTKIHEKSNQQVSEIKNDLVTENINKLNDVGVYITGNTEDIVNSIQNENDVYHFEKNVDEVVDYYHNRNQIIDKENGVETSIDKLDDVMQQSGYSQMLDSTLEEERKEVASNKSIYVNEDGTVQINSSSKNPEAMNFVTMMTILLVTNNPNFSLNTNMDMKFIKEKYEENNFKIIYGDFPIPSNGNQLDPAFEQRIYDLANGYNPNVSYADILNTISPELKMALEMIGENVLEQSGEFKMAVKSNGDHYDIKMGMDENYQDIITAFSENGAYMSEDMNGTIIVVLPSNMDQLVLMNAVLESLKQKGYTDEQAQSLVNQYQKKLVYRNEAAHVPGQLLIVITLVCVIEILGLLFFMIK